MPIEYRTRLPGGIIRIVQFDKNYNKTVQHLPPKKKKGKKK